MKFMMFSILAVLCLLLGWSQAAFVNDEKYIFEAFTITLSSYRDMTELDESLWQFSKLEITKNGEFYDKYEKIYNSADLAFFDTPLGAMLFFERIGGSGAGAGIYRYNFSEKKLDYFESKGVKAPRINEIIEYKDINGDQYPEIMANYRAYNAQNFENKTVTFEWLPAQAEPTIIK